ncbi:MAG: DUF3727 domain-containing protein, partial [Cyanobacteria bacterium P01_F01_bin.42]
MEGEVITLTDETGHKLRCYIEAAVEIEGEKFALLCPVDAPVDIFAWIDDGQDEEILMPIEDAELSEIFATAQAVLEEQNLKLKRSALSLTVEGDLPEVQEEQILAIETEDEDEAEELDEFQLLATFFHEEQEYAAYTPVDPVLFIVKLENNQPILLSPEEFKRLQPRLLPFFEEHLLDDEL